MQEIFIKIPYLERLSNSLKKLTLFFLSNSVPFNEQSYQKLRDLELVTSRASDYTKIAVKFIYWLYNM